MANILQPLVDRLRTVGPAQWERIAAEAGVARTLPRKLVYGDRTNPRVGTVQPLLDYFESLDQAPKAGPAIQGDGQEGAHA